MSLTDLASLGGFVSGFAVLISLIFLYFQLRQLNAQVTQAEKFQQTLVKQARTSRVMEVCARLAEADFAAVHLRVMTNAPDLSPTEWSRFNAHAKAIFQNGEDTFSQYRRALLHEEDFQGFVLNLRWTFLNPGLRVAWKTQRESFPAPYVAFVDQIVAAEAAAALRPVTFERWKSDMAAELNRAAESSSGAEYAAP